MKDSFEAAAGPHADSAVRPEPAAPKKRKGKTVRGYERKLSGDRTVFVGRMGKDWMVRFFNPKNEPSETKFRLSADAMEAMVELHTRQTSSSSTHLWTQTLDYVFRATCRRTSLWERMFAGAPEHFWSVAREPQKDATP